jgi:hypothetical protein
VEDAEGEREADVAGQEEPELIAAADHLSVTKNRYVAGEEFEEGVTGSRTRTAIAVAWHGRRGTGPPDEEDDAGEKRLRTGGAIAAGGDE